MFVNCRTTLIETVRAHFADAVEYEGSRALLIPVTGPLPEAPLAFCLRAALTYHRRGKGADLVARG